MQYYTSCVAPYQPSVPAQLGKLLMHPELATDNIIIAALLHLYVDSVHEDCRIAYLSWLLKRDSSEVAQQYNLPLEDIAVHLHSFIDQFDEFCADRLLVGNINLTDMREYISLFQDTPDEKLISVRYKEEITVTIIMKNFLRRALFL